MRFEKTVFDVKSTGTTSSTVTVNLLPSSSEIPDVPGATQAGDITVIIPTNIKMEVEGPADSVPQNTAETELIEAMTSGASNSSEADQFANDGRSFLNALADAAKVNIRDVTVKESSENGEDVSQSVLTLNGIAGQDAASKVDAIMVDTRQISQTTLEINNIEFIQVSGDLTLRGGDGDNFISADLAPNASSWSG